MTEKNETQLPTTYRRSQFWINAAIYCIGVGALLAFVAGFGV